MTGVATRVRSKISETARRCAAGVAVLVVTLANALALDFGSGALPLAFEPAAPVAFEPGTRITVDGTINGDASASVVLRIDDGQSTDYYSRMNDERTLPPGPFMLSFDTAALRTSNGRALNPSDIRRVILFIDGAGAASVSRFASTSDGAASSAASTVPREQRDAPTREASTASKSRDFGTGRLPLKFESSPPTAFADGDEIHVEGVVHGTTPAAIALRLDDTSSTDYASRHNDERSIPAGPFRFSVALKGLKTPSGRTLDATRISRVVLFAWQGDPQVTIARFDTSRGASMPAGAQGFSFGALDAAVPAGFERIGPTDSRVSGRGPIQVIRRPAPDPLLANGLKGVRRIALASPAKRVRVTVWSEDPGEWEALPHPFDRRIQINGRDLLNEKITADQWIAQRYLRGGRTEHTPADDAWTAYGSRRGNATSIDVDAGSDGIVVELSGTDLTAYFLNAVLIEPVNSGQPLSMRTPAQIFVDEQRAQWYRDKFPVAPKVPADIGAEQIALTWGASGPAAIHPLQLRAAPDTGASLPFEVSTDTAIEHPRFTLNPPRLHGSVLGARLWAAQFRLERDESLLRLRDDRLLADVEQLSLRTGAPRGYELWIDVPNGAAPGLYRGALDIKAGARSRAIPIEVTVLPVTLPQATKPTGFYLARAPHLSYFSGLTIEREQQVECDLTLMRGLGLTNTAPPIGGLGRVDLGAFASDMRRAQRSGVAPGWLIYNPLNELTASQGLVRAADTVARLEGLIKAQALAQPLWSVADEPSNPDQSGGQLAEWVRLLRAKSPGIRLGGHLNTPSDQTFVPLFDTLILNAGFGIDATNLQRLRASGKGIWLYNTAAPRQTAGLWLWRTVAERYIQWHARMPTSDPFDPLDGREADFQMIYPTVQVCPRQPDIHRDLLRMAEGIVDQRWLIWLDGQTQPAAIRLRDEFRAGLPGPFADARSRSRTQLESMRARIIDLAVQ